MPRLLLATDLTGNPSEVLTFAAASFFTTLIAGVSAYKMLTGRGEKLVLTASWFAAGVFFGTAMMDLLRESDFIFHWLRFRFPLAFLLCFVGYAVAMLVDCLLASAVKGLPQECFKKYRPKAFDKIMLSVVKDLGSTRCCDTDLPVGTSKSETKDCEGIGYLRYLILYRATLFVDCLFVSLILGVLSMGNGVEIQSAKTKTMTLIAFFNATLHNIIYVISLVFTMLRLVQSIPFTECLFVIIWFSTLTPGGVLLELILSNNESLLIGDEAANLWFGGIYLGFCSGLLVYLSVHHLLADGYELERSVSDTRFSKFVAMVVGVGVVTLLKVLDM